MKRYQLTKPFVGDKVYEASLKKGAKKCYNDVKKEKIPYINSFTIREIDTGKTYTYQIHNPLVPQRGGDGEPVPPEQAVAPPEQAVAPPEQAVAPQPVKSDKLDEISSNVKTINSKVDTLEGKIGIIEEQLNVTMQRVKKIEDCNQSDICVCV